MDALETKIFDDFQKKQDRTVIYEKNGIHLTRGGTIVIENPQESLIKQIEIDCLGGAFFASLIPSRMDADSLEKIYSAITDAGTTEKGIDLKTATGLSPEGSVDGDGCYLDSVEINEEGRQEVEFNNTKLKEHRLLGKSEKHAEAVLEAILEAFDAIEKGLHEKAPDVQRRMMKTVGCELKKLHEKEHGTQEQER